MHGNVKKSENFDIDDFVAFMQESGGSDEDAMTIKARAIALDTIINLNLKELNKRMDRIDAASGLFNAIY